jgi:predicted DNA-binding ribbon-helix-helix protein
MPGRKTRNPGTPAGAAANHRLLDSRTWQALSDIAAREGTTAMDLLQEIAETARSSRLVSAVRIFVVEYYRSILTETIARYH